MKILLTGATGFVGRLLLPRLLSEGHDVRCLVRDETKAAKKLEQVQLDQVELFQGDAQDESSIEKAIKGCDLIYYLIHSMGDSDDFRQKDRECAENFSRAADRSGVNKIIYLSGLANENEKQLSSHLASRLEVGQILRAGSTPCLELRAAMIVGKDSLSFRMVKHLCHRLPVMLCPKWLMTKTQPLAIDDLLDYLLQSIDVESEESQVFEIGGANQTTYLEILKAYCRQKGLRRLMIPVPILTPKLSGYWLQIVTPETASVGRELIDGLRNENLVRSSAAFETFDVKPMTVEEAIRIAIQRENDFDNRQSSDTHSNEKMVRIG